jgi:hypothetical protein
MIDRVCELFTKMIRVIKSRRMSWVGHITEGDVGLMEGF